MNTQIRKQWVGRVCVFCALVIAIGGGVLATSQEAQQEMPDGPPMVYDWERTNKTAFVSKVYAEFGYEEPEATEKATEFVNHINDSAEQNGLVYDWNRSHMLAVTDLSIEFLGYNDPVVIAQLRNSALSGILPPSDPRYPPQKAAHEGGEDNCIVERITVIYCDGAERRSYHDYMHANCWESLEDCMLSLACKVNEEEWANLKLANKCAGVPAGTCVRIASDGTTTVPCDDVNMTCNCFEESNGTEFDCEQVEVECGGSFGPDG